MVLILYIFLFTRPNNYLLLLCSALSNPGFLFSECAHVFFISTQPGSVRGAVWPWLISFLEESFIMPLRKFYLKIRVGCLLCSARPGTTGGTVLPQLLGAPASTFPPSDQWGSSLFVFMSSMMWDSSNGTSMMSTVAILHRSLGYQIYGEVRGWQFPAPQNSALGWIGTWRPKSWWSVKLMRANYCSSVKVRMMGQFCETAWGDGPTKTLA